MSAVGSSLKDYTAATGASGYDAVSWSAPPISKLVAIGGDGVHAIRHLGTHAKGTLQTRSRGDHRPDALLLARRCGGVFESRAGGEFKASQLARDLCCYLPHGIDADLEFPSHSQGLILHFPAGFLARQLESFADPCLEPVLAFRNPALAAIMGMVEQELAAPSFGHELMLEGLYSCISASLAKRRDQPGRFTPERLHMSPAKLRRVLDYIEGNLAQKITIKELADVAGISMFHFCRVFKKATNQTPYQYVCSRRLLNAQLLMANGQNSLAEIGLSCGFSSQAHFTNAFLKETGMPPGRYRRMMINN